MKVVAKTTEGQECQLIKTIADPVRQIVSSFLAEVYYRLLIGHAAFMTVSVSQLVDLDYFVEGFDFFLDYQSPRAPYAVFRFTPSNPPNAPPITGE